jgi:three-Cys-motif partner protein
VTAGAVVSDQVVEASLATGTSAGLLDSNDHAQSMFKHAIVKNYIPPFLAMTGSTSEGRRVVVMDGFAGRGRYADRSPGSAELILQAIQKLRDSRTVAAFFAETDSENFQALESVVGEYARKGLRAWALRGAAEDHLAGVVAVAQGLPLFLFLDPCGAMLPFMQLARVLGANRRASRPPTEVLLNFSAEFTRRTAGQLVKGQNDTGGANRMDRTCGGPWWRQAALDAYQASHKENFEPTAEAVVSAYAQKLAKASNMYQVTVPVRRRLRLQPVYHLVFLTRSEYGIWVFADALGKARRDWLTATGTLDDDSGPQPALPGLTKSDDMKYLIDTERSRAQKIVEGNLLRIAQQNRRPFKLVNHANAVFGDAYGIATDASVLAAVRALETSGRLVTIQQGNRIRDRIVGPA